MGASPRSSERRGRQREDAVLRLARNLAVITDPAQLQRELLAEAVALIGGEDGGVSRWDPALGILVRMVRHKDGIGPEHPLFPEGSASGQIALTKKPMIVNDYSERYGAMTQSGRSGAKALVAAPLMFEGKLLGAISVTTTDPNRKFSEHDAESLEILASLAAANLVGFERARLEGVLLAARTAEHELNNRLAIVSGYSEMVARDERLPADVRDHATEILHASDAAAAIVQSLRGLTGVALREWGPNVKPTIDVPASPLAPEVIPTPAPERTTP